MNELRPQISVIIHFLNASKYLAQAIDSVVRQTFSSWELILVDGGSHDRSAEICRSYQEQFPEKVRYVRHGGESPLGIFSSRIWGAKEASAPILALLDSDDEWHPQFLERHYAIYQSVFHASPGIVYCPVTYWWEEAELSVRSFVQPVPAAGLHSPPNLVLDFLENHYQKSAANSAVMIGRDLILEAAELIGRANEGMVEDQFLWSFLLLRYPVFVNPEPLVRYRQWGGSTCAKTSQKGEHNQIRRDHLQWLQQFVATTYQGDMKDTLIQGVQQILDREFQDTPSPRHRTIMPAEAKMPADKFFAPVKQTLKAGLQRIFPEQIFQRFQRRYRYTAWRTRRTLRQTYSVLRAFRARIRFMASIEPLSYQWGDDRGGVSIYRYYIEQFLQEYAKDIQGHCLEFMDDHYATRFGGERIRILDILHIDESNPKATLVADLTRPNTLPDDTFDCIICTHVLHVIFELEKAVAELYRILKPGGVLLVAVPHVSMCDPVWHELWRFTPEGLQRVLETAFDSQHITNTAYGNSLTAAGGIRGLAARDFSKEELESHHPYFALEICARAAKNV